MKADLFEKKYQSKGGLKKLAEMRASLETQKAISLQFGVSRERVRQWMLEFFNDIYDPRPERKKLKIESMIEFARNNSQKEFCKAYRNTEYFREVLLICFKKGIY